MTIYAQNMHKKERKRALHWAPAKGTPHQKQHAGFPTPSVLSTYYTLVWYGFRR